MTRRHRVSLTVAVALASVVSVACGVPQDGAPRTIDADRVPYGLLDTGPSAAPSPGASGQATVAPQVFFLDAEDRPVPHPQELPGLGFVPAVTELLRMLAAGPSDQARAEGLSTALGPGIGLRLVDLRDRVARIAVVPSEQPPTADRLPLSVGQIVFTVTSVDGIDRVQLVRRGQTIEVPLPGGARTVEPVSASDYLSLLTGSAGAATAAP